MKYITIQHKNVLQELQQTGIYRADINRAAPNLIEPYKTMMSEYDWINCPIFLAIENRLAEMAGAKTGKNYIALEFDIPDEYIKIQDYYDWADVIFFTECPSEFNNVYGSSFATLDEFSRFVLHTTDFAHLNNRRAYQATVQELRKEWLVDTLTYLDKIEKAHICSGGQRFLQTLAAYTK